MAKKKAKAADNGRTDGKVAQKKGYYPVVAKKNKTTCLITVVFERDVTGEEMETLKENFRQHKIKADPEHDLESALAQQLSLELQEAHNAGLAGFHQVKRVRAKRGFARKKMGWKDGDTGQRGGKQKS
jgi:hypothetical protein